MASDRFGDLFYPFPVEPGLGQGDAVPVGPGVSWLRMPLPSDLGDINIWAIEDSTGWSVVDSGMRSPEAALGWERAIDRTLGGRPIRRMLATHMHPDHAGMLGWLNHRAGSELWMTQGEYFSFRMMLVGRSEQGLENMLRFYRAAGWSDAEVHDLHNRFRFDALVHPLPEYYRRISDGDRLLIGNSQWEVLVGAGHSVEHASFYSRELGLFIAGDQVLPRMSSNVSVGPVEPEANPLADWLTSLQKIRERVSNEVLVLPSHGPPFRGLHQRIDVMIGGYERKLAALLVGLNVDRRTVDSFELLFRRSIHPGLRVNMTGETLAHLHLLRGRGLVQRNQDAAGVHWWRGTG